MPKIELNHQGQHLSIVIQPNQATKENIQKLLWNTWGVTFKEFEMTYCDSDGDQITVDVQEDFDVARQTMAQNQDALVFKVKLHEGVVVKVNEEKNKTEKVEYPSKIFSVETDIAHQQKNLYPALAQAQPVQQEIKVQNKNQKIQPEQSNDAKKVQQVVVKTQQEQSRAEPTEEQKSKKIKQKEEKEAKKRAEAEAKALAKEQAEAKALAKQKAKEEAEKIKHQKQLAKKQAQKAKQEKELAKKQAQRLKKQKEQQKKQQQKKKEQQKKEHQNKEQQNKEQQKKQQEKKKEQQKKEQQKKQQQKKKKEKEQKAKKQHPISKQKSLQRQLSNELSQKLKKQVILTEKKVRQLIRKQVLGMIPELKEKIIGKQQSIKDQKKQTIPVESAHIVNQNTCKLCQGQLIVPFYYNPQSGQYLCNKCQATIQNNVSLLKIKNPNYFSQTLMFYGVQIKNEGIDRTDLQKYQKHIEESRVAVIGQIKQEFKKKVVQNRKIVAQIKKQEQKKIDAQNKKKQKKEKKEQKEQKVQKAQVHSSVQKQ